MFLIVSSITLRVFCRGFESPCIFEIEAHLNFDLGWSSGAPRIFSWEGLIKKKIYYIRGATAPKSQDRLKWLLSDGSTGGLVISKRLIPQP